MKAHLFLAEGFEEIEATTPIDILRRAEFNVTTVSISFSKQITGAHGLTLTADKLFGEVNFDESDLLILPGGMPGTKNLDSFPRLISLIHRHHTDKKLIAAICAAPSILGKMGILLDKEVTCYPGFETQLAGAVLSKNDVVQSGNIITGKGPGSAMKFSLKIIEALKGRIVAERIAQNLCFDL